MSIDVPSPIDFKSLSDATAWSSEAMLKRPYRKAFFRIIGQEISALAQSPSIIELGSGPGFLADHLTRHTKYSNYIAFDFSTAMHKIARELHPRLSDRVQFATGDFRTGCWNAKYSDVDIFISMQAIHEVRHKSYAQQIFGQVRDSLRYGGAFLYCDHFFGEGGLENEQLYLSDTEKETILRAAGFLTPICLHKEGTLSLWKAIK